MGGWWYYYLYALAIKVPLGTWILILLALVVGLLPLGFSATWRDELIVVAPLVVVLTLVSSQTGFDHHMRYVLPIFPFAFVWMSKVARALELGHRRIVAIGVAVLIWSVASSLWFYSHNLSYFNELVGGPTRGHAHLLDSNIDWGQDLLYLKRWLDKHAEANHVRRDLGLPELPGPRQPSAGADHERGLQSASTVPAKAKPAESEGEEKALPLPEGPPPADGDCPGSQ